MANQSVSLPKKQKEKRKQSDSDKYPVQKKAKKDKTGKPVKKLKNPEQAKHRHSGSASSSILIPTSEPTPLVPTIQVAMRVTPPGSPRRPAAEPVMNLRRGSISDGEIRDSPPRARSPTPMPLILMDTEIAISPPRSRRSRSSDARSDDWYHSRYSSAPRREEYHSTAYYPTSRGQSSPSAPQQHFHSMPRDDPRAPSRESGRSESPGDSSSSMLPPYWMESKESEADSTSLDAVVSSQGPGSPEEPYISFNDLMARLVRSLDIEAHQQPGLSTDRLYDVVRGERSTSIALPFITTLRQAMTQPWDLPANPQPASRKYESMYRVREEDIPFLFRHPKPNSVVVESSQGREARGHTSPRDKEGRKVDSLACRVYAASGLGLRISNYTSDGWVLSIIHHGYGIKFNVVPSPNPIRYTPTSLVLLDEIHQLLAKGAICRLSLSEGFHGFYSRYFTVPKRDGGLRPILDLRALNRSITPKKFRMTTLQSILPLLGRGDWFTSLDLKDTCFHISIHPSYRRFLRFAVDSEIYEFNVLPFGLATAPRVFTKCMAPVCAHLRLRGIKIYPYLDDWLLVADTEAGLLSAVEFTCALLHDLGLCINRRKSSLLPTQVINFIGARLDSMLARAFLPRDRRHAIAHCIARIRQTRTAPAQSIQSLLGHMSASIAVVPHAKLRLRPLHLFFNGVFRPQMDPPIKRIRLPASVLQSLLWWIDPANLTVGVPFRPWYPTITLGTDASLLGWGAICSDLRTQGIWSQQDCRNHINFLELLAVFKALQSFEDVLLHQVVQVTSDNMATVFYLNKQGGTRSRKLARLAMQIWDWCIPRERGRNPSPRFAITETDCMEDTMIASDTTVSTPQTVPTIPAQQSLHPDLQYILESALRPSTKKSYGAKWQRFSNFANLHSFLVPSASVSQILQFLFELHQSGLKLSSIKIYTTAISHYRGAIHGLFIFAQPLIKRFLRGLRNLHPTIRPLMPTWSLSVVLQALS
ncbi:Transposon Ty3-I Gag-Pol polyprotein [Varanus komodoensis]|nr:Transposon Ty3-I Gag-Pol polyprotein [Varanus komodoensis]